METVLTSAGHQQRIAMAQISVCGKLARHHSSHKTSGGSQLPRFSPEQKHARLEITDYACPDSAVVHARNVNINFWAESSMGICQT
jgi:hypothetical protein